MFPQPRRLKSNWQKKKHIQKHFINDGASLSLYLFGYVLSRNGRELTFSLLPAAARNTDMDNLSTNNNEKTDLPPQAIL